MSRAGSLGVVTHANNDHGHCKILVIVGPEMFIELVVHGFQNVFIANLSDWETWAFATIKDQGDPEGEKLLQMFIIPDNLIPKINPTLLQDRVNPNWELQTNRAGETKVCRNILLTPGKIWRNIGFKHASLCNSKPVF